MTTLDDITDPFTHSNFIEGVSLADFDTMYDVFESTHTDPNLSSNLFVAVYNNNDDKIPTVLDQLYQEILSTNVDFLPIASMVNSRFLLIPNEPTTIDNSLNTDTSLADETLSPRSPEREGQSSVPTTIDNSLNTDTSLADETLSPRSPEREGQSSDLQRSTTP